MTIVAYSHPFVVGVDTHARKHVYAIIAAAGGELLETREFPTTGAGINRAIAWVARRTGADLATLWVIEGAASYGAVLAGAVAAAGYQVAEAAHMAAMPRRGVGKWRSVGRASDRFCRPSLGRTAVAPAAAERRRPRCLTGPGQCASFDDHRPDQDRERVDRAAPDQ
jgi:hypothetical protein